MKLAGKILWLTEDSNALSAQLKGEAAEGLPEAALHYGVNTDAMINGAACTLGYTPEILGPYFLQNFKETATTKLGALASKGERHRRRESARAWWGGTCLRIARRRRPLPPPSAQPPLSRKSERV